MTTKPPKQSLNVSGNVKSGGWIPCVWTCSTKPWVKEQRGTRPKLWLRKRTQVRFPAAHTAEPCTALTAAVYRVWHLFSPSTRVKCRCTYVQVTCPQTGKELQIHFTKPICMYVCMHACVCTYICIYAYVYMYVFVCVYMYVCMYMYACIYLYVCICIYVMYICLYMCMYVYVYMCVCMCLCICVYMYVYVCMCIYICLYMCMNIRAYMYVYMHICMCVCSVYFWVFEIGCHFVAWAGFELIFPPLLLFHSMGTVSVSAFRVHTHVVFRMAAKAPCILSTRSTPLFHPLIL